MYTRELKELRDRNLLRHIISPDAHQCPVIRIGDREYIDFSSNDYLCLSGHATVKKAVQKYLDEHAFGSGASRLLAGGSILHEKLEKKIAAFKGTESALVFNSGYSANTGIIPALASDGDVIFSDELNHASIIDGCRLSRAKTVIYHHKDISHLRGLITRARAGKKIIITDTVFSMDGDIAPLRDLYAVAKQTKALLYLDDAHGTGVLGDGRGALAYFQLKPEPWVLQMGTFSKALGSFGAFVAGREEVITWVSNTARSFIYSTALPSCVIAASLAAVDAMKKNRLRIKRLWFYREKLADSLQEIGYDIMGSETPIIPIRTGTVRETLKISALLFSNGIYAPAIRPPAVSEPRIRLTITAGHRVRHIRQLIDVLKGIKRYKSGYAAGITKRQDLSPSERH